MRLDAAARDIWHTTATPPCANARATGPGDVLGDHNDPQAEIAASSAASRPACSTDDHEVRTRLPFPPGACYRAHSAPPRRPISIMLWTAARARVASAGSTCTSSVPCRSDRNNASGVIIFM